MILFFSICSGVIETEKATTSLTNSSCTHSFNFLDIFIGKYNVHQLNQVSMNEFVSSMFVLEKPSQAKKPTLLSLSWLVYLIGFFSNVLSMQRCAYKQSGFIVSIIARYKRFCGTWIPPSWQCGVSSFHLTPTWLKQKVTPASLPHMVFEMSRFFW